MTKRTAVGYIYFAVVIMMLLMRISSALDVYSALGIENADAFFTPVVQILIFGVLPCTLYWLAVSKREDGLKGQIRDFGVKKIKGVDLLLTLALAVVMIGFTTGVSYIWQIALSLMGFVHTSSPTDYSSIGVLIRELVLVAALPGIFEEVSHRGLIYAGYKDCGYKFVIVSALLFSLMHENIVQTGYTFVDGLIMALAMYYTGSIFPGMILHFLNNAYSVFSGYVAQNGGAFDFINKISDFLSDTTLGMGLSVALYAICAALIVLILIAMRKRAVRRGNMSEELDSGEDDTPLYKDVPFIATVCVGVAATLFSFVWGMTR